MKISIRPAPHSKSCAADGRKSCDLYQNHQEKCQEKCTDSMCCEMKHCWQIGEALEKELTARGHTVYMADKKYRKRWPDKKAAQATKDAMAALNKHNPDLHLAIHTNANGNKNVRGIQAMYPAAKHGERALRSKHLCQCIIDALSTIYDAKLSTREYIATETATCPGAGCYLELGYGNTNKADAQFVHERAPEIAVAIADGIEAWWSAEGHPLPDKNPPQKSLEERVQALEAWRATFPA